VRVVLDTNIVVSGAFFGGPPRAVLDAWLDGRLHVVVTPLILEEYLRVCDRLRGSYPDADYQPILTQLAAQGSRRTPTTTSSCDARTRRARPSSQEIGTCLRRTVGTASAS